MNFPQLKHQTDPAGCSGWLEADLVAAERTEAVASLAACPSWGAFEGLVGAFLVATFRKRVN